jgi:hypothetical protein
LLRSPWRRRRSMRKSCCSISGAETRRANI